MLVFVNQEIKQVNGLNHAIVCGLEALGRGDDIVPTRLASNPQLDTLILGLTVGIMCDFVDDNALGRVVGFEH